MVIKIEKLCEDAEIPVYAKAGDAGMDIRASQSVIIGPGETKAVPTGLCVSMPWGYELQVRPRSGMSLKTKLRVANTPGTIDSGYRGEIFVILDNISRDISDDYILDINGKPINGEDKGNHGYYYIHKGDRIAQIILNKVEEIEFELSANVSVEKTERGVRGLGSTGYN